MFRYCTEMSPTIQPCNQTPAISDIAIEEALKQLPIYYQRRYCEGDVSLDDISLRFNLTTVFVFLSFSCQAILSK